MREVIDPIRLSVMTDEEVEIALYKLTLPRIVDINVSIISRTPIHILREIAYESLYDL